jgi:hypothetical protein
MGLLVGDKSFQCRGRIVWAFLERTRDSTAALYRAGVQFIEADSHAVEAFLTMHGVSQSLPEDALAIPSARDIA